MALIVDLTSTFLTGPDTPTSGGYDVGWAGAQSFFEVSGSNMVFTLDNLTESMGYWWGTALNYGALVVLTNPDQEADSLQSGSWFGSDASWGTNGSPLENHDTTQLFTDDTPRVVEGINVGEYNPFPIPPEEPEEPQRIRDATRFQKAYSFSRHQPVRIRVFKR